MSVRGNKFIPEDWEVVKYIRKLKELKPLLRKKFKVSRIGIFGSFARNSQTEDSDIDILVEFYRPIGLQFFDLREYLEKELGRKVDLVSYSAISPYIKPYIEKDVIFI